MRSLLFWSLFPFVVPQALWVRRRAPRATAAGGPRDGAAGAGLPIEVLAIGDSIVAGVGAPTLGEALVGRLAEALATRLDRQVRWRAIGRSGARAAEIAGYVDTAAADPAVVVVSAGVNDVTGLRRTAAWRADLERLLQRVHERFPEAVCAIVGLPPLGRFPLLPQPLRWLFGVRATAFDAIAAQMCAAHAGAVHVPLRFTARRDDFSPDGFHPSPDSYRALAEAIADALMPMLRAHAAPPSRQAPAFGAHA